jgi:transcriptional repressor NrdR
VECPVCGGRDTKVVDSRESRDGVRRRRVCNECGHRFTTRERIDETLPMVLKRTGERQPFDRAKIRRGLDIACRKRGIPSDSLDRLVTQIETWASTRGEREVSSEDLGERIMHHLYAIDQVAYVRFVSVYRSFETIAEFEHLLREMQKAERVDIEGQRTLFPEMVPEVEAAPVSVLATELVAERERARKRKQRRKQIERRPGEPEPEAEPESSMSDASPATGDPASATGDPDGDIVNATTE